MAYYDPNEYKNPEYHYSYVPQRTQPDTYNTSTGWDGPGPSKKKNRSAAKMVASLVAVAVVASAAGGGTAIYVLNNNAEESASAYTTQTTIQTTSQSGSSPAEDGSVASVAQVAADSVVEIDTKTQQQSFFSGSSLVAGSGSGVIISEDGYIVTNNHVVQGAESIVVRTRNGDEHDATVIGTDSQSDLAVIKIEAAALPAVTFADSDSIQVGQLAVAIGNPLGELGGTVTSGIISATGREVSTDNGTMTLLQTSAAINPGNSGGGLFDSNGHLIGIVNAKSAGVEIEGLGFAIPSNTVQKVVADIIDNGYVTGRAIMGIQVVDVQDSQTAMMLGVTKAGVYVQDPGRNEGLKSGDRFVFIDGVSIDTGSDVSDVLSKHEVGETLKVTVERDGRAVETQVTLSEYVPETMSSNQSPEE